MILIECFWEQSQNMNAKSWGAIINEFSQFGNLTQIFTEPCALREEVHICLLGFVIEKRASSLPPFNLKPRVRQPMKCLLFFLLLRDRIFLQLLFYIVLVTLWLWILILICINIAHIKRSLRRSIQCNAHNSVHCQGTKPVTTCEQLHQTSLSRK